MHLCLLSGRQCRWWCTQCNNQCLVWWRWVSTEQCAAAPTSDCLMPTTFLLSVTHTPSPPGLEWIGCGDEISDCVMPVPAYYLSSVLVTLWSETTHSYWCFIATWWQWCPAQHLWLITTWQCMLMLTIPFIIIVHWLFLILGSYKGLGRFHLSMQL